MPTDYHESALKLRNLLIGFATGKDIDEREYCSLRSKFLHNPQFSKLVPDFVRKNMEKSGLWQTFKEFQTGSGAYAARRRIINESFEPLLSNIDEYTDPASQRITSVISDFNANAVEQVWHKALSRMINDPEGAITSARTLLEEVSKHILEDKQIVYDEKWDLPRLYSECANALTLAPSQHTEKAFRRILGNCQSIIETLGEIRNKVGDAHGGGSKKVRPAVRHAALAVNLSGAMSTFLLETHLDRKEQIRKKDTERLDRLRQIGQIEISSRYNLNHEINSMECLLLEMPSDTLKRIKSIWCDSKAGSTYNIEVKKGAWNDDMPHEVSDAFQQIGKGHNGVHFTGDAADHSDLAPDWIEDISQ